MHDVSACIINSKKKFQGSCHCKKVLFYFFSPSKVKVIKCNCSICKHLSYLHLIIPHDDFKLLSDNKYLRTYKFGTMNAYHLFCLECGIKSFYQPRSHSKSFSINYNSIINPPTILKIIEFDGKNFEKSLETINLYSVSFNKTIYFIIT